MFSRLRFTPTAWFLIVINIIAYCIVFSLAHIVHSETTTPVSVLAPHITMGTIELKVANYTQMEKFYETMLGMQVIEKSPDSVTLGYYKNGVIQLDHTPTLRNPGANDPGLDQIAIVFNSRPGLAKALKRITDTNPALYQGGTDRGSVGEAFYVIDPQGNSLELYYDTDPSTWQRSVKGNVESSGKPIDVDAYMAKYTTQNGDPGMKTGHLQIRIGDLVKGRSLYVDTIGFYAIPSLINTGGLFLSDGFYHHDLVINQAQGWDGDPLDNYLGLKGFSFRVPDGKYLSALEKRLDISGVPYTKIHTGITFTDYWGVQITVTTASLSFFETVRNRFL